MSKAYFKSRTLFSSVDDPRGRVMFWSELQSCRPAAAATSPGLFKEWVSAETPGRLPLGPVVLLGQPSGRPVGLVCVCVRLCFPWKANQRTLPTGCLEYFFLVVRLNEGFIVRRADCMWTGQGAGLCRSVWSNW